MAGGLLLRPVFQGSKDATALKRLCDDWVGVGYGGENEGDGGVNLDKAFSKFCGDRDELTVDLFAELLEHLGVEANDERVREAFYGTDRPDVISFAEFMTWWLRNEATYIVKRSDPIPRDDPAHTKTVASSRCGHTIPYHTHHTVHATLSTTTMHFISIELSQSNVPPHPAAVCFALGG